VLSLATADANLTTRWDKGAKDVTRYAELQAIVAENQGRLTDIKKGMEAGGGWQTVINMTFNNMLMT